MEALEPVFTFVDQNGALTIILLTAILLLIRSVVVSLPKMFMSIQNREDVVHASKVGESFWFFVYYSIIFTAGLAYLWDKEWLHDPRKYWLDENALIVPEFPIGLQLIYTTQTAFYISASIVILFFSHARKNHKDKIIMITHHAVTITLLAVSYTTGQHRIGSVVLILHDVSDIFLEGAKLCRYAGFEGITNYSFGLFALVFFVSRLIILPYRVLWAIIQYYPSNNFYHVIECTGLACEGAKPMISIGTRVFWLSLLGSLQCLHFYWFALIFRMILVALRGELDSDIRSDDETDLAEAESPEVASSSKSKKRKPKSD